jgi:hypothetical protein
VNQPPFACNSARDLIGDDRVTRRGVRGTRPKEQEIGLPMVEPMKAGAMARAGVVVPKVVWGAAVWTRGWITRPRAKRARLSPLASCAASTCCATSAVQRRPLTPAASLVSLVFDMPPLAATVGSPVSGLSNFQGTRSSGRSLVSGVRSR